MAWAQGKDFKGFGYRYVSSFQITDTVIVADDTGADDTVADTATVGVPISSGRYRYQFAV